MSKSAARGDVEDLFFMPLQFSVPQFIDVENKILGPIAVRQFLILVAAVTLIFIAFKLADLGLFIFITVVIVGLAIVFAFIKINGRPFHYFVLNLIDTMKSPYVRIWKKEAQPIQSTSKGKKKKEKEEVVINYVQVAREKQKARSRLSDLSLLVDTGGYYGKN